MFHPSSSAARQGVVLCALALAVRPGLCPPAWAGGATSFGTFGELTGAAHAVLPPVRAVTRGPAFHWFGYYDKDQLDASGRYLLSLEADFENRLPLPGEAVRIGMIDLADGDRWIALGESRAWSWQQGCMLQWRPGSLTEVVWNDREGDGFVCRVLDVATGLRRTLPMAIEHLSPDGRYAACADFSRLWDFRPGYGYAGVPDPYAAQPAPPELGVWRLDMATGATQMLVSLADVAAVPYAGRQPEDKHYVNHLQWSPDGQRILFFDRWSGVGGMPTRVFTIGADGRDLRLLSAEGASHYAWRDPEHVLIWSDGGYRLYRDDGSGTPRQTVWAAPNGHQSYIPGTDGAWLIADSYPQGAAREQWPYLFHVPTGRFFPLGRFVSTYSGEWRCDLHPRITRDGRWAIFDSPHGGDGRQLYRVDVAAVIAAATVRCAYRDVVRADRPAAYWPLNAPPGATFAPDEQGAADGTFQNFPNPPTADAGLGQPGPRPAAVADAGSDGNPAPHFDPAAFTHVDCGDHPDLALAGDFTLEAWIRLDALPGGSRNPGIVAKYRNDIGAQRSYVLNLSAVGKLNLAISPDGGFSPSNQLASARTFVAADLGRWFHVAGVYDRDGGGDGGGALALYIDGRLDSTRTRGVAGALHNAPVPFWIGRQGSATTANNQFDGFIDEVAVYDRALAAGRIAAHHAAGHASSAVYGAAVQADHPVGYWPLNESSGATTADDAQGRASGSYVNFPHPATASAGLGDTGTAGYPGFEPANTAAHFDPAADTRVSAGDDADLDILGDLTLEAWIRLDELAHEGGIVGKYQGAGNQRAYQLAFDAAHRLVLTISPDGAYAPANSLASARAFGGSDLGVWCHVAGVYDADGGTDGGGALALYVDGCVENVKTAGVAGSIFNAAAPLLIGEQYAADAKYNFNGLIDEVAVYGRALSAAQIRAHYAAAVERQGTLLLVR